MRNWGVVAGVLRSEKIFSVCNKVLLIVTWKQQQKELVCQLSLSPVCQTWPQQIRVLHKGWGPGQREREMKHETEDNPWHRKFQRKRFVSFCSPQKKKTQPKNGEKGNRKVKGSIQGRQSKKQFSFTIFFWSNLLMLRCSSIWESKLSLGKKKFPKNKFKDNHMFYWKTVVGNCECTEIKRGSWNRQKQNKSGTRTFKKKGTATPWGWCWKPCIWATSSAAMFLETPNSDTWEQANSEQPAAKALLAN